MAPPSPPNPALAAAPDALFTPRKEFKQNQRIASEFSLLTLSGPHFVRLYNFPSTVTSAIRRLFTQHSLITTFREDAQQRFYEFTLEGKPWANSKSIKSEKLIVDIFATVLHFGYAFLSTIDYGREQDDRIILAFSKPMIYPVSSIVPLNNASAVSLQQPIRAPFAISFASQTVMRVIGPPLPSTPAVLQAVRSSWPRGVLSDKKVGDATYEFKLKGYKWFQEDTFATDSLQYILGLLEALDQHGFTLLTSLSLVNRSRVKDLWVFTGLADENQSDSPLSTPDRSSLELRRENSPQSYNANRASGNSIVPGHPPGNRSLPSSPLSTVSPTTLSSLKSKTPTPPLAKVKATTSLLRKPSPKKLSHAASASEGSAVPPDQSPRIPPSVMDMTGVGAFKRMSAENQQTPPAVIYATSGRQNGDTSSPGYPFHTMPKPSQMYPTPSILGTPNGRAAPGSRRSSLPVTPSSEKRGPFTPIPPVQLTPQSSRPRRSSTPSILTQPAPPGISVYAPSPISATSSSQQKALGNGNALYHNDGADRDPPAAETPRTATPHLLNPEVFRDSAFSSSTTDRQSYEIPIGWAGNRDDSRTPRDSGERQERQHSLQKEKDRPELERFSTGPLPPGAWSNTPTEEHDVVNHSNSFPLPPTIQEQPSQESDDVDRVMAVMMNNGGQPTPDKTEGMVPMGSPERISPLGDMRKSEAAVMGVVPTPMSSSVEKPARGTPVSTPGAPKERTTPSRKETSGWVMVNIEGKGGATGNRGHQQTQSVATPSSPPTRPPPHGRSSSDSRIPSSRGTSRSPQPFDTAAAPSSMSAAAKAIVIIDAVDAKEQKEQSGTGSAFKRFWGKATGSPNPSASNLKNSKGSSMSVVTSTNASRKKLDSEQVRQSVTRNGAPIVDQSRKRGVPMAKARRSTDKRFSSID
ncbi:hypothetical protein BXZ70DRAFT_1008137 [Cristinia sonorae]|uniref:Uncharacterized protein n=1 Tax=Cristinia sonorae TaxID=1940300 RepID=A0A8K0XQI3_9AGAR|nr:hypothetical protein BXZ70DRAFT_1008137 [Cristinia sonorae]